MGLRGRRFRPAPPRPCRHRLSTYSTLDLKYSTARAADSESPCRSVKTAQMVMAQRLEGSKFVFPVSYLREKAAPTELVRITCSINIRLEFSVRRTSASKVESVKTSGLIVPWREHWSAYLGERSTCSGCRVKTMDLKSQSSSLWHSNCANMGNDP